MCEEKGYVVCLLKYMLGEGTGDPQHWDKQSGNKKTICLGYFGRADVVPVYQFKDYMQIASENDAEFIGSRKQLLLYPFDGKVANQIKLADADSVHGLPFRPAVGDDVRPCFCCLSILNINQSLKDRIGSGEIRTIAQCLSDQIALRAAKPGAPPLDYAVMGLLGTEDICVILLSADFTSIADMIEHLRSLTDRKSKDSVIQNSHSVIMVDYSGKAQPPIWGDGNAEIHFSLKTAGGLAYLKELQRTMDKQLDGSMTVLESQVGEYDIVIRCPAAALGAYLYGYQENLNYINADYRNAVYQSETILYQKVGSAAPHTEVELASTDEAKKELAAQLPFDKMAELVSKAISEINCCMLGRPDDPEDAIRYIRLGLFRLLKDFMRMASIPFGRTFQHDLYVQFHAAINAIVFAAKQYGIAKKFYCEAKSEFDETFSQIVNALSNSMQAASQVDRLSFEEQQSHLQNTGAYHKVLLAYYGIVKDILTLIYSIDRNGDSEQPMLIPLLSFGHTPIIFSEPYYLDYNGKPAKLICVTLPYQALTNIPKHIGPLVHELFHYSSPANRELRNEAAGKFLIAAAFQQFLDKAASCSSEGSCRSGQDVFSYHQREFLSVVNQMYDIIRKNQSVRSSIIDREIGSPKREETGRRALNSGEFFRTMREALMPRSGSPIEAKVAELYCSAWVELRKSLLGEPYFRKSIVTLFALDKKLDDEEALAYIKDIYQRILTVFLPAVDARLSLYERALREIPPDLFDISFVMHEKPNDLKARQYLWQIHGIRCDKLYYNAEFKSESNHITTRIGVILDYLIFGLSDSDKFTSFSERSRQVDRKLEQWYGSGVKPSPWQTGKRAQIRKSISNDYGAYQSESLIANILLKSYLEPIAQQIQTLSGKEDVVAIIQRLSDFYGQYYTALENEVEDLRATVLFDLAIQIIEHYQKQPTLDELSQVCRCSARLEDTDMPVPKSGQSAEPFRWKCEAKALHPKDLSTQIVESYNIMVPEGSTTPLWFRGQESETWSLLPGVMRSNKQGKKLFSEYGFLFGLRKMLTLAKAKILPRGETFHEAEWLAFLQHNGFKTNLLDWSEDLHSALFFAIEPWMEKPEDEPKEDASISVFNPVLFNLAQDTLEKHKKIGPSKSLKEQYEKSLDRLCIYLKDGIDSSGKYAIPLFTKSEDDAGCEDYFRLNVSDEVDEKDIHLPIAAMTPVNSERMKMQAGVFVFFDVRSKPQERDGKLSYKHYDLSNIQQEYFQIVSSEAKVRNDIPSPKPFLYKIILNRHNWKAFVKYVRAIGIRKYKMYPEIDKLAGDITEQAFDGNTIHDAT